MIRLAKQSDAEELEKIIEKDYPYTLLTREKISGRMNNPKIQIFVKELKGKVVGFADLKMKANSYSAFVGTGHISGKDELIGFINAVSVIEGERKMGHGTKLIHSAVEAAKKNGANKAELLVKANNSEAKKLYKKMGFSFFRTSPKLIQGETVEVWQKEL